MLQNKELLSLKQWLFQIGYTDRTVSFQTVYPVTIVIDNCGLNKEMNAKKTFTGPALKGLSLATEMAIAEHGC